MNLRIKFPTPETLEDTFKPQQPEKARDGHSGQSTQCLPGSTAVRALQGSWQFSWAGDKHVGGVGVRAGKVLHPYEILASVLTLLGMDKPWWTVAGF